MTETNWAGNYTYGPARTVSPSSVEEVQRVVAAGDPVKVLATRHSFTGIGDTAGTSIRLDRMPADVRIDEAARTVRVPAQLRYGDVAAILEPAGWALANLASLPHISVAGAVQTGTHGSGDRVGALPTAVVGVELVDGTGEFRTITRADDPDVFPGVVVGLGALGVVTALHLAIEPTYRVRQTVFEDLPWPVVAERFDELTASGYSVSTFTDWASDALLQVWVKQREGEPELPADFFGARRADGERHPLPGMSAENCTPQLGLLGPWHERLPHFRLEFLPSAGEELQSEYFIAREALPEAVTGLRALGSEIAPLLFESEIRTMTGDDLWLSPAEGRDSVALHFTWRPDEEAVRAALPRVESVLLPLGARPHWGKIFTVAADRIAPRYPRFGDFLALRGRFDPDGILNNAFLERVLG